MAVPRENRGRKRSSSGETGLRCWSRGLNCCIIDRRDFSKNRLLGLVRGWCGVGVGAAGRSLLELDDRSTSSATAGVGGGK
jgi:hypothetical protein